MALIPETDSTVSRIYRAYEQRENRRPRAHLGASMIGRECERELWLSFRWADYPRYEGRILRLFARGQREEPAFVANLRAAGMEVLVVDPATGRQYQFSDLGGHVGGSMDGAALGLPEAPKAWHVLEFKTHGAKSFAGLMQNGVLKAHPEHFAQVQLYMGWSGMDRAFYLAVCKDTDELYGERIAFDRAVFEALIERAGRIVFAAEPPPRISESPAFFRCKFCLYHGVCHGALFPKANCRTCAHVTPRDDGAWHCARHDKTRTTDEQHAGCPMHLFIPPLMPLPVRAAGEGWVRYEFGEQLIANVSEGAAAPAGAVPFASAELSLLAVDQLETVISAKQALGGQVVDAP